MAALAATLLAACAQASAPAAQLERPPGDPSEVTDRWYDADGALATRSNTSFEVHGLRGPEHCDWEQVWFLSVVWPPTRTLKDGEELTADDTRQYVRDAGGALGPHADLAGDLDADTELPAKARSSGYHTDHVELWFGPDRGDRFAYLVFDSHVERWPRAEDHIACG